MNKKGGMRETLVRVLLFIAAAVLVFYVANFSFAYIGAKTDLEQCRLSVLAQTKTAQPTSGYFNSPIILNCPRKVVEIYEDKVMVDGKPDYLQLNLDLDNELTKEDVNYIFAEEMRECWYKFGEGRLDVFNEDKWDRVCMICSKVSFDKNNMGETYSGFRDYLRQHSSLKFDDEMTYETYLNQNAEDGWIDVPDKYRGFNYVADSFSTGSSYLVYFIGFKEQAGADIGGFMPSYYTVYVGDTEESVNEVCDYIYS